MQLASIILVSLIIGFLICAHLVARRRKCSTVQVIRDTLTIQGGGGKAEE